MALRNSALCSSQMPTGKPGPCPAPALSPPAWLPSSAPPSPARPRGRPGLLDCLLLDLTRSSLQTSPGAGEPFQPQHLCPQHRKQPDAPEEKPRQSGADPEQGGASVWPGEQGGERGKASGLTGTVLRELPGWALRSSLPILTLFPVCWTPDDTQGPSEHLQQGLTGARPGRG